MSTSYFVGSGIASLAGAAYLIRDGGIDGGDIVIFEASDELGGALDAHGDASTGYFMSGSRMFENKYACTLDLMASIPSTTAARSITQDMRLAAAGSPWNDKARLVDRDHAITDFDRLGFDARDRADLLALMATPERALDSKRITDRFQPHFFETNFWLEWCTLFAFQPWHSAIELHRYLLRFVHHFSTIDTEAGVFRTRFDQYDSIAVPLVEWLRSKDVTIRMRTTVEDLGFADTPGTFTVESITCSERGARATIALRDGDRVFVTNGSMTAAKRFGTMTSAPEVSTERGASWDLWRTLARGRPAFGNPAAFDEHVEESGWESFTVTDGDPRFFERMRAFSRSDAGEGGLITFKDSAWLVTISIFHQPFFSAQAPGTFVWWGYGLRPDRTGDYVRKPMSACTGAEILHEVLGQLGFADDAESIVASSIVVPCSMPYITSQFLVRKSGDRPLVVPEGSTNLAFIGQFCEVPDDVVFTVEYSIRSAQSAVYSLLGLEREPTPMYRGIHDPGVVFDALRTLLR